MVRKETLISALAGLRFEIGRNNVEHAVKERLDPQCCKRFFRMRNIAIRKNVLPAGQLGACESSDLSRGAIGAGSGYLIDRAVGGDGMVGAAVGATAGVVCDDVTPQYCN